MSVNGLSPHAQLIRLTYMVSSFDQLSHLLKFFQVGLLEKLVQVHHDLNLLAIFHYRHEEKLGTKTTDIQHTT